MVSQYALGGFIATSAQIADGVVTTPKIADANVTLPKINTGLSGAAFSSIAAGLNVFKDSHLRKANTFLYLPSTLAGTTVYMTNNAGHGLTPTSNRAITNPGYATDDDWTNYARISATAVGDYIRLDLGSIATRYLELRASMGPSNSGKLQKSDDGSVWTDLTAAATGTHTYNGEQTCRYVQIVLTTFVGGDYMDAYEFAGFTTYASYSTYPQKLSYAYAAAPTTFALRMPMADWIILSNDAKVIP